MRMHVWPSNQDIPFPEREVDPRASTGHASTYFIGKTPISSWEMNIILISLADVPWEMRNQLVWDDKTKRLVLPRKEAKRGREDDRSSASASAHRSFTEPLRTPRVQPDTAAKRVRFADQQMEEDPIEEADDVIMSEPPK